MNNNNKIIYLRECFINSNASYFTFLLLLMDNDSNGIHTIYTWKNKSYVGMKNYTFGREEITWFRQRLGKKSLNGMKMK